jgi:hypothetical protein
MSKGIIILFVSLVAFTSISLSDAKSQKFLRVIMEKFFFHWDLDPKASEPCISSDNTSKCFNHIEEGFTLAPVLNIHNDQTIVFQEEKRRKYRAAIVNISITSTLGCYVSTCRMDKWFGLIPAEDCFSGNGVTSSTPLDANGRGTFVINGIFYENLPPGELYLKFETKNALTNERDCVYDVVKGHKHWIL